MTEGFLANISEEEISQSLDLLYNGDYEIIERCLLRISNAPELFEGTSAIALNEITIQKANLSMITINVYVDGAYLNTYWADGLIVATPTGSTAYSLSCTGPILTPQAENFVITPIASHNLTVRPIVIPDKSVIKIRTEGRGAECYVGLDSRTENVDNFIDLIVRKEDFTINLLQMSNKNFFKTIREKLNWGLDVRN